MAVSSEEPGGGGGKEPRITPKFGQINEMLRPGGEIEEATKAQQEAMGKIGAAYKKIEKELHGNRQAVGFIRKLDKMSKDKRDDLIRTLEPMLVERGYTLDVIDPEDLAAQAQQPAATAPNDDDDDDDGEDAGDKETDSSLPTVTNPLPATDALSAARDRLSGGGDGEPGAGKSDVDRGSRQLRKLIGALRTGDSVSDAAAYAGMTIAEAQEHAAAEKRGDYVDIAPITPGDRKKRDSAPKPKLGIVVGGKD